MSSRTFAMLARTAAAALLIVTVATHAGYVVAPEIANEYLRLRDEVRAHPDDPTVAFEYAVCLSYMGKVEDGRAALRQVRKLDPSFAKKTLPRYLRDAESRPQDSHLLFRVAFLRYFNDQSDLAFVVFEKVANQQPVGPLTAWALAYMAVIKSDGNQWEDSEKLVRQALKIEPDAYALHAALAAALRGQGRYVAATGAFFTALNKRTEFENYEREHFPGADRDIRRNQERSGD
jgi:tetratricopeptide (TPR) repeat protein